MSLTITPNLNSNQFTTPKSTGLNALNAAAGSGKPDDEVRGAFDSFVGETFYSQMIKSMHKMHSKPAYFHGGRAEEAFQTQLDQQWTEQMSKATAHSFTEPMYKLFSLSRS
jgi:Rod binding domain-containing protein